MPANGAGYVSYANVNLSLDTTNAAPGYHAVNASITGGGQSRYLYAPELVQVLPALQPPTLDTARLDASQFGIGVNGLAGQRIVLQGSTDLLAWQPLATNTLTASQWLYTNSSPASLGQLFYRAVLAP